MFVSVFRNPDVKDRLRGLRAPLPDFSPPSDLPSGPDPAGLGSGADHPQLDDEPAEGTQRVSPALTSPNGKPPPEVTAADDTNLSPISPP